MWPEVERKRSILTISRAISFGHYPVILWLSTAINPRCSLSFSKNNIQNLRQTAPAQTAPASTPGFKTMDHRVKSMFRSFWRDNGSPASQECGLGEPLGVSLGVLSQHSWRTGKLHLVENRPWILTCLSDSDQYFLRYRNKYAMIKTLYSCAIIEWCWPDTK